MKNPIKESGVLRACLDLLEAERIEAYRMNSGKILLPNRNGGFRAIQLHPEGTPDILFHLPAPASARMWSWFQVGWVETKVPGKRPSIAQLAFKDAALDRGEIWLWIDDVTQLQYWLKENRAR